MRHKRMISGEVIWCRACGCYGDTCVKGLAGACLGKPNGTSGGGRYGQLNCLRTGRHPKTRQPLLPAIDEEGRCFACHRGVELDLDRLVGKVGARIVSTLPDASSSAYAGGTAASDKMRLGLERVRANQKAAAIEAESCDSIVRAMRRLRCKQRPDAEWQDNA